MGNNMKIKAVKFNEKGFMTRPFALGGEDGMEKFDAKCVTDRAFRTI